MVALESLTILLKRIGQSISVKVVMSGSMEDQPLPKAPKYPLWQIEYAQVASTPYLMGGAQIVAVHTPCLLLSLIYIAH